jgi:hypothetical protein
MNVGQTTSVKGNYPGNMSNKLTARRFALEVNNVQFREQVYSSLLNQMFN